MTDLSELAGPLRLLTEEEAAAMLHLSPRTLRELRSKGKIRYVRPSPRKVFYTAEDIAEHIARNSCQDTPSCPSINPRKAATGTSTSSGKVIGITEARAARQSAMQSGMKPISGDRRR